MQCSAVQGRVMRLGEGGWEGGDVYWWCCMRYYRVGKRLRPCCICVCVEIMRSVVGRQIDGYR